MEFSNILMHFLFIVQFFLIPACITLVTTPIVRRVAEHFKILDYPSSRKIHSKPTPLLGGVAIFLSINASVLLGYLFGPQELQIYVSLKWPLMFLAQVIILVLGIFDDIKHLKPRTKFLTQILVGVTLYVLGFHIQNITNPFNGQILSLHWLALPVTIIWVVGITNALNLLDGLDGLAAGTSFIACISIAAMAFFNNNTGLSLVALVMAGSTLGFLKFNFHPAKIFLGDSGSLLLGLLLSIFSIEGSIKGATLFTVMAPILVLGLPIMDTLLAMIRRLLKSLHMMEYSPDTRKFRILFSKGFSMFEADMDHVHHRLLKIGFSQKKAVGVLFTFCGFLGTLAFLSVVIKGIHEGFFLGAIIIAFLIGIRSLKYSEFKILQNGMLLPIFDFPVVSKKVFQALLDLVFIAAAFFLSSIIILGNPQEQFFLQYFPFILVIKIFIFYLSGIYKISWIYSSIEDLLKILKTTAISSLIVILILVFLYGLAPFGGIGLFIFDFYLLMTFVTLARFSYRILQSIYAKKLDGAGVHVLIYGAGHRGSTVLREIRHNGSYSYIPVGFVDDDIQKKGKSLHNCPILGSFEDVEQYMDRKKISEIIVSTDKIKGEKLEWLKDYCRRKGIVIRQFEYRFYEFT